MSKRLGLKELTSIGIGGMIGGGIFAVLGLSLQLAGTAAFLAFLFAGLVALATGYSYAKLSVEFPSKGGTIEFLAKGIRNQLLLGTLSIMLLVGYTIMIALYAYAFGAYAASSFHGSITTVKLLGSLAIAAFVLVNALGAVVSGKVEDELVFFKLAVLLLVTLLGLRIASLARLNPSNWPSVTRILVGGLIIFLAYEGFELISHASADAERLKDVERAFYLSIAIVILVYVLLALISSIVLTPKEVEKFRDYALAILAKKELGLVGYWLVVLAALASTASAINATLFGTAGISYIVAKLGELPETVGKRIWRSAPEGLIIVAAVAMALLWGLNLQEISFAGSATFLLVFFFVNLAAFRLSKRLGARKSLPLLGMLLSLGSLGILAYHSMMTEPLQLVIFITIMILSACTELAYRLATGRQIHTFLDRSLSEREQFLASWRERLTRARELLVSKNLADELYVPKSLKQHSRLEKPELELVVVTKKGKLPKPEDIQQLLVANGLVSSRLPLRIRIARELSEDLLRHFEKL